jgi:hypothetical protein
MVAGGTGVHGAYGFRGHGPCVKPAREWQIARLAVSRHGKAVIFRGNVMETTLKYVLVVVAATPLAAGAGTFYCSPALPD